MFINPQLHNIRKLMRETGNNVQLTACFRDNEPVVLMKLCLRVTFDLNLLYTTGQIKSSIIWFETYHFSTDGSRLFRLTDIRCRL